MSAVSICVTSKGYEAINSSIIITRILNHLCDARDACKASLISRSVGSMVYGDDANGVWACLYKQRWKTSLPSLRSGNPTLTDYRRRHRAEKVAQVHKRVLPDETYTFSESITVLDVANI